jgi:hypothetical protein
MLKRTVLFLSLFVLVSVLTAGCGTQTSTSSGPETIPVRTGVYTYLGTQSPGDTWSWTIGEGTLSGTNETNGYRYSGTFVSYASGFNKLTVTDSTDPSVPLDGTAVAYFLEYPNTMLVVAGKDDNPMVCTAKAAAAPSAGRYNFVNIPWPGWSAASSAYGTVEVTLSSGLYNFNVRTYDLSGVTTDVSVEAGFSFSDGRLSKSGNPLQVFLTPSGAFFGDSGPGSGGFCGAANQSIDLSDLVSKEYRGVMFSYDASTGTNLGTTAIGAEPNPSLTNALTGFGFEDVELNTRQSDTATVQFGAQDASGVLSGTLQEPGGAALNFKMVVAKVSGKYIVLGISQDSSGNPQNMLLVEI